MPNTFSTPCAAKLTRQTKQDQPVHNQHRPENWQIKNLKPAAEEANSNRPGGGVPELELRQPPDKRPELLIFFCGKPRGISVLHALILFQRGVEFRGEKSEEEI